MKTLFTALTFVFCLSHEILHAQAVMVKDINLGLSDGYPIYLTNVKDTLYFVATTATDGKELWKSDGTAAGTAMVKDIYPGPSSGLWPRSFLNFKDTLYFAADDGTTGYELWKSDGTTAGTALLKDINPTMFGGLDGAQLENALINFAGAIYFMAYNGVNGTELWKSDGTTAGTMMVKNISNGSLGTIPSRLYDVNGTLFFMADDGINGSELWKSDGTGPGTVMVKDIYPGATGSETMGPFTVVNDTLFFWAKTVSFGTELWKSDGTPAGTVMVKDINPGATNALAGSNDKNVYFNGALYFAADDGTSGKELWKTNGTTAGTVMVKDIFPGSSSSNVINLTVFNGALYVEAMDGVNGYELWTSDGTTGGTMMLKDISPGNLQSMCAYTLTNVHGALYFCAQDGTNGSELWKSDGTGPGTFMAADINAAGGHSYPFGFTSVNGDLYFAATDGIKGVELWKFDSTSTVAANEINFENAISIYPNPLTSESVLKTNKHLNNAALIVYNSFGQAVKQMNNLTGQDIIFHRDQLPAGLYFIQVTEAGKLFSSGKLIITDN